MKTSYATKIASTLAAFGLAFALAGCTATSSVSSSTANTAPSASASSVMATTSDTTPTNSTSTSSTTATQVSGSTSGALDASELFTDRDLTQTVDISSAKTLTLASDQDVTISEEGVYVISGTASNATIVVDTDSSAKVQIVLDGATVTNDSEPIIYVKSADKVFVTAAGTNSLTVTGTFSYGEDDSADAVIFSRADLVLNGTGTLKISSSDNGVTSKDDLKITGGTYQVTSTGHAFEANDSIVIADGSFTINAGKDGFNADNDEDGTLGYVYVGGGTFQITAKSDGIRASSVAQVDDGTITISAPEGIEGTYVQINGGSIDITATDDGINATRKSSSYAPAVEITDGNITIKMGSGDTDAIDSNGSLFIKGGTIVITANSPFDYDGQGSLTGGTVTVNGQQVTQLTNQMMGGGVGMQGQGSMGSAGNMNNSGPSGGTSSRPGMR